MGNASSTGPSSRAPSSARQSPVSSARERLKRLWAIWTHDAPVARVPADHDTDGYYESTLVNNDDDDTPPPSEGCNAPPPITDDDDDDDDDGDSASLADSDDDSGTSAECSICCEKFPAEAFSCLHAGATHAAKVCRMCFVRHCKTEIEGKQGTKVICPNAGCKAELQESHMPTPALRAALVENHFAECLRGMEDFCWCAHPGCGSGQIHVGGADAPVVSCQKCDRTTCFVHHVPFHTGRTCSMYDAEARAEDASDGWVQANCKICPKCQRPIQKNNGCDHMTCKCCHEFCWLCLADYAAILKDGNHAHQPTCMHWREPGRA